MRVFYCCWSGRLSSDRVHQTISFFAFGFQIRLKLLCPIRIILSFFFKYILGFFSHPNQDVDDDHRPAKMNMFTKSLSMYNWIAFNTPIIVYSFLLFKHSVLGSVLVFAIASNNNSNVVSAQCPESVLYGEILHQLEYNFYTFQSLIFVAKVETIPSIHTE